MRNLIFLFLVLFTAVSCDDTELNTPIIQAEVDGRFYRSRAQAVVDEADKLIVKGSEVDVLTLRIDGNSPGVYPITSNSITRATFLKDGQLFITTGPTTGGEIVLEKVNQFGVSGTFTFNARLNGVGRIINFSKGVFFDVPLAGGNIELDIEIPDLPEGEGD